MGDPRVTRENLLTREWIRAAGRFFPLIELEILRASMRRRSRAAVHGKLTYNGGLGKVKRSFEGTWDEPSSSVKILSQRQWIW